MSDGRISKRVAGISVLLLTLFAVGLRLRGLDAELPHYTQSDGLILAGQVERGRAEAEASGAYGRAARTYPHLISNLVLLLPDGRRDGPTVGQTLEEHHQLASTLWMDLRRVSVLIGALLVPLTYALARRFLPRGPALFASALIATSLLHTSLAQMERPHAIAATTTLLGVLAALRLARRPTPGSFLLAGVGAGLAVGTLQSGLAVLLPLAAAFLLSRRLPARAPWWWGLASLAIIAVFVRWLYPFQFGLPENSGTSDSGMLNLSGHLLRRQDFDGSGFLRVLGTMYSYEPVLLFLAVAGGVAALLGLRGSASPLSADLRRNLFVAGAYAVPYLCALGMYSQIFERFVLQLLPFFACLAAGGVARALRERSAVTCSIAGLALLVVPTLLVWKLGSVRAAPDTAERVAAWMEANLDEKQETVHVLPYLTLPLFYEQESLERNWKASQHTMWLEYQRSLEPGEWTGPRFAIYHPENKKVMTSGLSEDPLAYFMDAGASYVVLKQVGEGFRVRVLPETRVALQGGARRVARFSPMTVDPGEPQLVGTRYLRNVLERPFTRHLWEARCMGSTLEIYKLP